jgi:hypothetical protein
MDKLKELLKNNLHVAMMIPALTSTLLFLGNLCLALKDGILDDAEFHKLATSANGFEMLVLLAAFVAFKNKK